MFKLGLKRDLEETDLFEPLEEHSCAALGSSISLLWHKEFRAAELADRQPNMLSVLCRYFGRELCLHSNILMVLELFVRLLTPMILGFILQYFNQSEQSPVIEMYNYSYHLSLFNSNYFYRPERSTYLYRFWYMFSANQPRIEREEAVFFSCAIVACVMLTSFIMHPYMIMTMHTGMRMRIACSSLLYRKVNCTPPPQMINFG